LVGLANNYVNELKNPPNRSKLWIHVEAEHKWTIYNIFAAIVNFISILKPQLNSYQHILTIEIQGQSLMMIWKDSCDDCYAI